MVLITKNKRHNNLLERTKLWDSLNSEHREIEKIIFFTFSKNTIRPMTVIMIKSIQKLFLDIILKKKAQNKFIITWREKASVNVESSLSLNYKPNKLSSSNSVILLISKGIFDNNDPLFHWFPNRITQNNRKNCSLTSVNRLIY
jgi:hypothetical protein